MKRRLSVRVVFFAGMILSCTAAPAVLRAQAITYAFDRLTVKQGLPGNIVQDILQDRQGFIWLATSNGLARYDGYRFTVFRYDPDDPHSPSDYQIRVLYEDRSGALWVGTVRGGLNRFDPATERFTRYLHDPGDPQSLSHNTVITLTEDRNGNLWVGTADGLNRLNRETGHFTRFHDDPHDPDSLNDDRILSTHVDRDGRLWIGTGSGLHHFDPATERFTRYLHDPNDPRSLGSNIVNAIYEDRKGNLWVGTYGSGLSRMDRTTGRFTHYRHDPDDPHTLSSNNKLVLFEDGNGTLWIGTMKGLNRFDPLTGRFVRIYHDPNDPYSLSSHSILTLMQDREGMLWIGTYDGGLNLLDPDMEHVRWYRRNPGNPHSLSHNTVHSFTEDQNGRLWVGTEAGLDRLDDATGQFTHYRHTPGDPNSISSETVRAVYTDRAGTLWAGLWEGGLNRYVPDGETERFVPHLHRPDDPNSISRSGLFSIYEDGDGLFWLGTGGGGLNRYDPATGFFTHYTAGPDAMHRDEIRFVHEDRQGILWVGTPDGLGQFDRATCTFTWFLHDPEDTRSLRENAVTDFYQDEKGVRWIATEGGGLNRFVPENIEAGLLTAGTFQHFLAQDGLLDSNVRSILPDDDGNLWLGTGRGITRFDVATHTFQTYDFFAGLRNTGYLTQARYKRANGTLVFGSQDGFIAFHPDSLRTNPYAPPLVLTSVERHRSDGALTRILSAHGVAEGSQVTLSYTDKVVTVEFAALSYRRIANNRYAYRLEGLNEDWIQLGTQHSITVNNLSPGTYTLQVRGSNGSGVWNEKGLRLRMVVLPPWWRSWWAYTLYASLILGTLYAIRRYELNRISLKERLQAEHETTEKLRDLDKMKSDFFANISHEFRTPLTLILGPLQQALNGAFGPLNEALQQEHQRILRNGRRLQRLINQILDLTRLEAGTFPFVAHEQDLVSFARQRTRLFETIAQINGLTLSFASDRAACPLYFSADHLEKILGNLLSNAVKFTPSGGQIRVIVEQAGDAVLLMVKDQGIGIDATALPHIFDRFYQVDGSYTRLQEGTGIGLALTKELVELHGGTISVASTIGRGSRFTVRLPRGRSHLRDDQVAEAPALAIGVQLPTPESTPPHPAREETQDKEDITTVLVVEDNADMRAYIRTILHGAYRILEASTGRQGLERAREALPDLIISDVMMPEMDGLSLSRALKNNPMTDCIPVILLTARTTSQDEREGLDTGADHYVRKPFDANVLLARVRNLLALRQRLQERYRQEDAPNKTTRTSTAPFEADVRAFLEDHLHDQTLDVGRIADALALSPSQLRRRLQQATSASPNQLLREMRLTRARALLGACEGTVSEVAYAVGFNSLSYFDTCYRTHFGVAPSDHLGIPS